MGSLTGVGHAWALLSVTAAILCCSSCYLPYWIQGRLLGKVDAYFNSFRRCNYPRASPQGSVELIMQCARYSRYYTLIILLWNTKKWKDIPSWWWQVSTVLVAVACGLSIMVAVMAASGWCVAYVLHSVTARLAGLLQLLAGLLVCGGAAVFPLGLDNREVRDTCGPAAHVYSLGNCKVSWGVYLLAGAVAMLLFCFALSPWVARDCYQ